MIWKQQIFATFRGLDLLHLLDGTHIPYEFLPSNDQDQEPTINPFFLHYHKQDQLIVAWLLASMSSSILTKMVGLDSSAAIWTRLSTYYASHTRATIKKLCLLLRTPKNYRTVANYLFDIKKTVDSLSAFGASISNVEHIDVILNGLSEEYDDFIIAVLSRSDPYTADELEFLLLAQEERFEKHKLIQNSVIQAN